MSSAAAPAPRRPNPVAVLIRVVVVTLAFGVLGLGIGGLLGIIAKSTTRLPSASTIASRGSSRGRTAAMVNPSGNTADMSFALFAGGVPGAAIGLLVGFAIIVRSEQAAFRNASGKS